MLQTLFGFFFLGFCWFQSVQSPVDSGRWHPQEDAPGIEVSLAEAVMMMLVVAVVVTTIIVIVMRWNYIVVPSFIMYDYAEIR